MTVVENSRPQPAGRPKRKEREFSLISPRFWHGMTVSVWLKLLARNRFAISPTRMPMAFAITGFSLFNSTMRFFQEQVYGRQANAVEITKPPLFIIGHWRSGTTLLHELLVLDRRHNYATTYQCFAPHHFLLTEKIVSSWFGFVLPTRRPMDNMEAGWDKPQEDEFALCNLGIPSPYLSLAFPNRPQPYREYLDFAGVSEVDEARWQQALVWFLKRLTLGNGRRIVLKSPPHTGRIKVLLDAFPEARFVHIVRDPMAIFPSTVRLWKKLNETQGLQVDRQIAAEERVLGDFERMYGAFEAQKSLVDPARFYQIKYEELVKDPIGQIKALYEHLDLGEFDKLQPKLTAYFDQAKDYQTNRHDVSPECRAKIRERWGDYIRRYGYEA